MNLARVTYDLGGVLSTLDPLADTAVDHTFQGPLG